MSRNPPEFRPWEIWTVAAIAAIFLVAHLLIHLAQRGAK
ncbi:hypothetical protein METEAL_21110 [Mesoterricola silvestris]|uniref:Uncharacterized protein n=1 Tax=Mesoterricola silvestris TaxID=2927979 RepID=A0AA48KA41_9BACT|nr:hypothetical protein METEAL_21110 [Mesoterricola silvestris]